MSIDGLDSIAQLAPLMSTLTWTTMVRSVDTALDGRPAWTHSPKNCGMISYTTLLSVGKVPLAMPRFSHIVPVSVR